MSTGIRLWLRTQNTCSSHKFVLFFFQAEDGIRDYKVTGVQTCALPILTDSLGKTVTSPSQMVTSLISRMTVLPMWDIRIVRVGTASRDQKTKNGFPLLLKIGRASCRERV